MCGAFLPAFRGGGDYNCVRAMADLDDFFAKKDKKKKMKGQKFTGTSPANMVKVLEVSE